MSKFWKTVTLTKRSLNCMSAQATPDILPDTEIGKHAVSTIPVKHGHSFPLQSWRKTQQKSQYLTILVSPQLYEVVKLPS